MIYFVAKQDDERSIKIGMTNDLDRRMKQIAAACPIVLFATCEGNIVEERYFQKRFSHLRVEGEWFSADDAMMEFIAQNSTPCMVEYGRSETRWTLRKPAHRKDHDALVAHMLIKSVIDSYSRDVTVGRVLEEIYVRLSKIGDGWTRRRVRAIYQMAAHRVDAFEMIDLLKLSGLPESEWIALFKGERHKAVTELAA